MHNKDASFGSTISSVTSDDGGSGDSSPLTNSDLYAFTIGFYCACALHWVARQLVTSMSLREMGQALHRAVVLSVRGIAFVILAVL